LGGGGECGEEVVVEWWSGGLSTTVQAADHSQVVRAVSKVVLRGEFSSLTETPPGLDAPVTLHTWRYMSTTCPNYPDGVGFLYMTALEGQVSVLTVAVRKPGLNGGMWKIFVHDNSETGLGNLDGLINEVRVEVGYPEVLRVEGQAIFDKAVECINNES